MECMYVSCSVRQEWLRGYRAYRTADHNRTTKEIISQLMPRGCTNRSQRLNWIIKALMLNTSEYGLIWWLGYFDSLIDDVFGDHD